MSYAKHDHVLQGGSVPKDFYLNKKFTQLIECSGLDFIWQLPILSYAAPDQIATITC